MAVIPSSWRLHWRGSTGSVSRNPIAAEYTAVYRLRTDDPDDQTQTVLEWVQLNKFLLGSLYTYANDTSLSIATLQRITADRDLGTVDEWVIVAHYASENDDDNPEGFDQDGIPVDNPLDFRPRVNMTTVTYTRPCEKAKYLGGLDRPNELPPGWIGPPCNSALIPYNPLPDRDDHRQVYTVTRNVQKVNGAFLKTNAVNLLPFILSYWPSPGVNIFRTFGKYECLVRDWRIAMRRMGGVDFWEVSCALDHNKDTWVHELVDRGVHAAAIDGQPDGKGGEWGGSDKFGNPRPPKPVAVPDLRRLVDNDQNEIDDPVLFDGKGQPLKLDAQPIVPVYGRWLCYEEANVKGIQAFPGQPSFFQDILQ